MELNRHDQARAVCTSAGGFLGLSDGADRSRFRDACHEPVAFIMAAQELVLLAAFTHEQEQVTVRGLEVKDFDFNISPRLLDDLEEFALPVVRHVQGNESLCGQTTTGASSDFQSCADAGKLAVEKVCVHNRGDTSSVRKVRGEIHRTSPIFLGSPFVEISGKPGGW